MVRTVAQEMQRLVEESKRVQEILEKSKNQAMSEDDVEEEHRDSFHSENEASES